LLDSNKTTQFCNLLKDQFCSRTSNLFCYTRNISHTQNIKKVIVVAYLIFCSGPPLASLV
jgi:hypothetical protein